MKADKSGIIHAYAQCNDCEFAEGIDISEFNRMQKLRNRIAKHIKDTGHTVVLETGNATTYTP